MARTTRREFLGRAGGGTAVAALGLATPFVGTAHASASTLVVCTEASPDSLNAQLSTANTSFDITAQIADSLVEMKPGTSDVGPALAESWTISPDGKTYTFKLRHGVQWQSNSEFHPTRDLDADDVVFSFDRMVNKTNPFYQSANGQFPMFASLLESYLQSVEKVSTDTVAFRLKSPLAPLVSMLSLQPFAILSAQYAAQLKKSGNLHDLDEKPIGTGPFSFVHYQQNAIVRFRAFADFWGKNEAGVTRAAEVDNLIFAITPNASVRDDKLRTNECQVVRYPNLADLPALRKDPNIRVISAPIAATNYIYFRVDKKPFNDIRVRRALAMAINIKDLVNAVFEGTGTPAASMVPPSLWGSDASLKPYKYDPTAAKRLLTEAGYPNGFSTDLWAIPVSRAYMPSGRRAAEMIQADWAKIGVKAHIVTYEWGEYLKRALAGGAEVGMLGSTWDYPDPSEIMVRFLCHSPSNFTHWCDQGYDQAILKANAIANQAERAKLYQEADKIIYDQVPLVRLGNVNAYVPLRKDVHGFQLTFLGGQPFGGVSIGRK